MKLIGGPFSRLQLETMSLIDMTIFGGLLLLQWPWAAGIFYAVQVTLVSYLIHHTEKPNE